MLAKLDKLGYELVEKHDKFGWFVRKNGKKSALNILIKNNTDNLASIFTNYKIDRGFDIDGVKKQAIIEFNDEEKFPFLTRLIQDNVKVGDYAQLIIDGTISNVNFSRGQARLLEPNARDVLTAAILNDGNPKIVGLLGTKPIQGKYKSSGKFGNFSSITNIKNLKYGFNDLKLIEEFINKSDLNKLQKSYGLKLVTKLKKFELDFIKDLLTYDGRLRLSEEDAIEFLENLDKLNAFLGNTFQFGTRNHRVIADAPKDSQIALITSEDARFGDQMSNLGLTMISGKNKAPLIARTPKEGKKSGDGTWKNILHAERTMGAFNVNPDLNMLKYYSKDIDFPVHVKGIGPNPVKDMITLLVDNIQPSFKNGGYVTFYKRVKNNN